MKRNFLLLLLMTLLPIAGWAANIGVQLSTSLSKVYGTADPTTLDITQFVIISDGGTGLKESDIASYLTFKRKQGHEREDVGTWDWEVTVDPTYTAHNIVVTNTGRITITPLDLSTATLTAEVEGTFTYNGEAKEPTPTSVKAGTFTLPTTDYTVDWDDNVNAGNAKIIIKPNSTNVTNEGTINDAFAIAPLTITTLEIGNIDDATYTGSAPELTAKVTADGKELTPGTDKDYTVATTNVAVTDAATATVTLSSNYSYAGATTKGFKIVQKSLSAEDITVAPFPVYTYRGTPFEPHSGTVVTYGALTLVENTDYTLTFGNNPNAGETSGSVTITAKEGGNYKDSKTVNFKISQRSITAAEITAVADGTGLTYTGVAQNAASVTVTDALATLTEHGLKEGVDYTVECSNNVNAGSTAVATITGIGNYTGTTTTTYSIDRAPLKATVNNVTKTYGTGNPTFSITYEGFQNGEDKTKVDETGLTYTVYASDDASHTTALTPVQYASVGTYDVVASGLTASNYDISYVDGKLTVAAKVLTITIANAEKTYGDADPVDYFKFTITDDDDNVIDPTGISWTTNPVANHSRAEGENVNKDGYAITCEAAASEYGFKVVDGKFTINPKEIAFTTSNKTTEYGVALTPTIVGTDYVSKVTEYPYATGTVNGVTFGAATKDTKETIGIEFVIDEKLYTEIGTHEKAIKIKINNDNYTLKEEACTWGTLTVTKPSVLNLLADNEDEAKIEANDGETITTVNVTLKRENVMNAGTDKEKTYSWNLYDWNTLVLPFEVTVREISNQLGYAIVNEYNVDNTTANDAGFKLAMGTIPANTPILVKTDEDIAEGKVLTFENKEIVSAEAKDLILTATNGVSFIGTYSDVILDKTTREFYYYADNKIRRIGAESENTYTVYPFTSYFNFPDASGVKEAVLTITVQEGDGTTTTIGGVKADSEAGNAEGWYNLNGMKLDAAPTQKGIYIQNGKKVLVK